MKMGTTGERYKVEFKDFSERFKLGWFLEALFRENVSLYWDRGNKAWCRRVDGVECLAVDGWYVPLPGQPVGYPQKMP